MLPDTNVNKPTLLAVGLFVPGTGFTRVFESMFAHLSKKYTIHWMGIGYRGCVIHHEHYTIHPVNVKGGDIYGAFGAAAMAIEVNATTVLLLNDFYMLKNYERAWQSLKDKGIRLMAYIPIDGYFNNTDLVKQSLFFHDLIFYSKWAMQEVQHAIGKYLYQNELTIENVPQLSYIYHGVDTGIFEKESNKLTVIHTRKEIFKVDHADTAIFILNANRYSERKDIDTTLYAFKKALPGFEHPAYLCLHMPANDPLKKEALFQKINELQLAPYIIYNPLGNDYVTNEQLCKLYQCCQVGINTSLGEGWGLVSFEHAACGGAQLVPAHTTPGELWKNAALLIDKAKPVQLSSNPFLMHHVSADKLAQQLVLLVNDETCLETIADDCYEFVQQDKFNWTSIATQWEKLIARSAVTL